MTDTANFIVNKSELLSTLKRLKKVESAGRKIASTLEITISNGSLQLVIPGAQFLVKARTQNAAKFTILLVYFTDIVNSEKEKELSFSLSANALKLRGFTFSVPTTFFEDDKILRSINLPIGYKYIDLVRLYLSEKFTSEEIAFNKLDNEVTGAINGLKTDIDKATSILRKYGFKREDIEVFITNKVTS